MRYLRVCNNIEPLIQRITILASKIKAKGAKVAQIKFGLKKCILKHKDMVRHKFDINAETFIRNVNLQ